MKIKVTVLLEVASVEGPVIMATVGVMVAVWGTLKVNPSVKRKLEVGVMV